MGCKIRKSSETKQSILDGLFACAMSQGPSLLETLTNAATTSEHRESVQEKEIAYGRKEGIAESG